MPLSTPNNGYAIRQENINTGPFKLPEPHKPDSWNESYLRICRCTDSIFAHKIKATSIPPFKKPETIYIAHRTGPRMRRRKYDTSVLLVWTSAVALYLNIGFLPMRSMSRIIGDDGENRCAR